MLSTRSASLLFLLFGVACTSAMGRAVVLPLPNPRSSETVQLLAPDSIDFGSSIHADLVIQNTADQAENFQYDIIARGREYYGATSLELPGVLGVPLTVAANQTATVSIDVPFSLMQPPNYPSESIEIFVQVVRSSDCARWHVERLIRRLAPPLSVTLAPSDRVVPGNPVLANIVCTNPLGASLQNAKARITGGFDLGGGVDSESIFLGTMLAGANVEIQRWISTMETGTQDFVVQFWADGVPMALKAASIVIAYCPADVDDGTGRGEPDGAVTIDDLLYYLGEFSEGTSAADLDDGTGSGTTDDAVTVEDLLYFLTHFEAGC